MIIDHDVHLHTTLSSCCGDKRQTPTVVLERARRLGLKTVGFANHLWDPAVPGPSDWYIPQTLDHVLEIRRQLPADTGGIRVLIGCESEYCGGGKVGITRAGAKRLDYVLIPAHHFHMPGFTVPADLTAAGHDVVADLMMRRFDELVALGIATGIAHPFLALGFLGRLDAILSRISEERFLDSFNRAATAGVSIEMHADMFPGSHPAADHAYGDETFLRIMSLAYRAGCRFHFASDAHDPESMDGILKLGEYADMIGITAEDVHPAFRS